MPTPPPRVDMVAPRVTLSAPASAACTRVPSVLLSGTASDDDRVARVTYRLNDGAENEMSIAVGATVTFSATISVPPGSTTITITAYDAAGNTATAHAMMRYSVSRLIAAHVGVGVPSALVVMDTEGDCRRDIDVGATNNGWESPTWDPTQAILAFQRGVDPNLFLTGLTGNVVRLLPTSQFDAETSPQFTFDGQWIYFAAGRRSLLTGATPEALWRVRSDGQDLQQISPDVDPYSNYDSPSPSPDGTRVVFVSNGYPYTPRIQMLDVPSRVVTSLNLIGVSPRWSPTGNAIAFLDPAGRNDGLSVVVLVDPSGGGRRVITPSGSLYNSGLSWSRDGTTLLAHNFGLDRLEAINVMTGAVAPVPNSSKLFDAAW